MTRKKRIGCAVLVLLAVFCIVTVMQFAFYCRDTAITTSILAKNRGLWIALVSANDERHLAGLPSLWPGDLIAGHDAPFVYAEDYFAFLMSDGQGSDFMTTPSRERLAPGLEPFKFGSQYTRCPATNRALLACANIWHVVAVGTNTPPEVPFMVSRNVKASAIRYPTASELAAPDSAPAIPTDQKLLPNRYAQLLWITYGGSTFNVSRRYATVPNLCPVAQPEGVPPLKVLPAENGYQ